MIAILQYIIYLASGFFFFMVIVPVITYGAGVRIWGLPLVFFPFLLAGYASGLSFLSPRAAAVLATIIASAFLFAGISEFYRQQPAFTSRPANLIIPAVIVLLISVFALRQREEALWKLSERLGKVILGIFAGVPAALATYSLFVIAMWVFGISGGG